jgi:exosortase/archaeosortase family protein
MNVSNVMPGSARVEHFVTRHRAAWPAVGLVAAAIGAYWFTLSSLADYLRLDTPLAYLLMLPCFALLIVVATVTRHRGSPAPREPHIDLLVGIPLLIVALLMVTVLPAMWSTYYWTERPDVLSLALFLSGGIIIAYGVTWFWRLRSALLFIVLMWPALYLHLMAGLMRSFTDLTNTALTAVAQHLPLGVTTAPGNILTLPTNTGKLISVTLSTACSGVNGVLGMALIGSALAIVFTGKRSRKLLWLATGIVLVFAFNIVRIISILTLAHSGHPELALGSYHATIGLVLFAVALGIMLLIAPLFGLHLSLSSTPRSSTPASGPARVRSLGRARMPLAAGIMVAAILTVFAERDLGSYATFIDGTGAPTVKAFNLGNQVPAGLKLSYFTTYGWAQQYFGSNSKFDRYVLDYGDTSHREAWMDIVRTDDRGALEAYNLQSCFLFHNYQLHSTQRIDVGHGVTALLLNYSDPETKAEWATVSWAWPVLYDQQTSYERITLTADLHRNGATAAPNPEPTTGVRGAVLSILNSFGGAPASGSDAAFHTADRALEGVANSLVSATLLGASS